MSNSAEVIQIHDAKSRLVRSDELAALRNVAEKLSAEIVHLPSVVQRLKVELLPEVTDGPGRYGLITLESDPEVVKVICDALANPDIARRGRIRSELPPSFSVEGSDARSIIIADCEAFYNLSEERQVVEVALVARPNLGSGGSSLGSEQEPILVGLQIPYPKSALSRFTAVAAAIAVVMCVGYLAFSRHGWLGQRTQESEIFSIADRTASSLDEMKVQIREMSRLANELKRPPDLSTFLFLDNAEALSQLRLMSNNLMRRTGVNYSPEKGLAIDLRSLSLDGVRDLDKVTFESDDAFLRRAVVIRGESGSWLRGSPRRVFVYSYRVSPDGQIQTSHEPATLSFGNSDDSKFLKPVHFSGSFDPSR